MLQQKYQSVNNGTIQSRQYSNTRPERDSKKKDDLHTQHVANLKQNEKKKTYKTEDK